MTEPSTPHDLSPGDQGPPPAVETHTTLMPIVDGSPFEPAESLPATRVASVAETGTFGAPPAAARGRSGVRWALALIGIVVVIGASALIVSLAGGRPTPAAVLGYMPASIYSYSEARLDLPGDQRQKLAAFLSNFPGFKDQSQADVKVTELLDRIVDAATKGKQTWSANIQPWFGGQIAVGSGLPDPAALQSPAPGFGMAAVNGDTLVAATITDRAKALAWLTSLGDGATINKSIYNGADLLENTDTFSGGMAVAVTDKVILGGTEAAVKAAVDSNGTGGFAQNEDVKAAMATLDRDYVAFSVIRTRAYLGGLTQAIAKLSPGTLDKTQLDDTALAMVPAWQATTARIENDAIVSTSASPSWAIGYDTTNRTSALLGHVPAKTIAYLDIHDAGPTLTAVLAKFRALPETKAAFDQVDQALSILGGFDAVVGWWGDTAFVVSPVADGTIGAGLVIKPRDAAAADRLLTTLHGFLMLAGGSSGVTVRDEDHAGTKITTLDFSAVPGFGAATLPPGYKAEFSWATNADVTVIGYGHDFVAAVLDAGPGNSLADDARFKALLGRVGTENITSTFVDMAAIRDLVEPVVRSMAPPAAWTTYTTEIKPFLDHLDAAIQAVHKDGQLDRGAGAFTVR